jgi:hypothetical protein
VFGFSGFIFFSYEREAGPLHQPNVEDQVIFGQGFLPLALDKSISNCRRAVPISVHSGYFISPIPNIFLGVQLSATWGGARWETSNFSREIQRPHNRNSERVE